MAGEGGRDLWKVWKPDALTRARGFHKGSCPDTMKVFFWFFPSLTQGHWGARKIITRITWLRCALHIVSGYHLTHSTHCRSLSTPDQVIPHRQGMLVSFWDNKEHKMKSNTGNWGFLNPGRWESAYSPGPSGGVSLHSCDSGAVPARGGFPALAVPPPPAPADFIDKEELERFA